MNRDIYYTTNGDLYFEATYDEATATLHLLLDEDVDLKIVCPVCGKGYSIRFCGFHTMRRLKKGRWCRLRCMAPNCREAFYYNKNGYSTTDNINPFPLIIHPNIMIPILSSK